jgi:hypothetical protein
MTESSLGITPPPELKYAMTVRLELGGGFTSPTMSTGVAHGQIGVLSGEFEGPTLRGRALALGGDTPVIRSDGVVNLDARYFLQVDDGTVIRIHNRGVFRMPADVRDRINAGDDVDPSEYYIRTSPTFEVPEGPHNWLTRYTFVGIGRRHALGNEISYYQVL